MKHFNYALCAAALATGMSFPVAAQAQTTELIFNAYLPPMNATRKAGIEDFAKAIEEASGGTLKITIPDASLAPSHQQYQLLLDGVADMAFLPTDDMSQIVTFNGIADIPYNAPTARAGSIALWETYKKYFEQHGEYRGVKVLSTHLLPGRQFVGIKAPLDNIAAFQNTKLWVPNGPLTTVVEELGVVPVHTNFPELFETVSKGLADGLVITLGSTLSARVLEKAKYYTEIPGGLGSVSFAISISDDAWSRLNEQQQQAILTAAEGLPGRTGAAIDEVETKAQQIGKHVELAPPTDNLIAAIKPHLDAEVEAWKERAKAKGIENPDEVLAFYHSVLEREAAGN